jgi:RND family efflux transporter MFP subunit
MLIQRNKTIISIFLTALLLSSAGVCAETVEYEGLIEPYVVVNIGAPDEGVVAKVTVDRSSSIEKGQILVEMESSVEQAALEQARVMATYDGDIHQQETQLAFAKRQHGRVKRLDSIPIQDKDQAATDFMLAKYQLKKAREERTLAQYELKKAQAILNRLSIKSPITGVVIERYVSPGEYVYNQPLLRVAQIDPLRVEVIVPAQMFGRIVPGMTGTIVPELSEYGEKTATVTIVDKVIDSASSTFGVRLELPNTEHQMPSGMKCQVRFDIDQNVAGENKVTAGVVPKPKKD